MLKLYSLAATVSVLGSSLLRSTEISSVSLWVHHFLLQRGRGDSLGEAIYLALKMQTCQVSPAETSKLEPGFWSCLWPWRVRDGVLDTNSSELSKNSWICLSLAFTQSSQMWGTLHLREECWNFSGRNKSCSYFFSLLLFSLYQYTWGRILWRGICRDFFSDSALLSLHFIEQSCSGLVDVVRNRMWPMGLKWDQHTGAVQWKVVSAYLQSRKCRIISVLFFKKNTSYK